MAWALCVCVFVSVVCLISTDREIKAEAFCNRNSMLYTCTITCINKYIYKLLGWHVAAAVAVLR